MARVATQGTTKVNFAATIADQDSPTAAELLAGTDLQSDTVELDTASDQAAVDDTSLASIYDAELPGSYSFALNFTIKRESVSDAAWNLIDNNTTGFITIRRQVAEATAFTIADDVEVYPGAWGVPRPLPPVRNEQHRFAAKFFIADPGPSLKAVVA